MPFLLFVGLSVVLGIDTAMIKSRGNGEMDAESRRCVISNIRSRRYDNLLVNQVTACCYILEMRENDEMKVILFSIGGIEIRSYGVIVALAILLAIGVAYYLSRGASTRNIFPI